MPDLPTDAEYLDAQKALRQQYALVGLSHMTQVGLREAAYFKKSSALETPDVSSLVPKQIIDILLNEEHPNRVKMPLGPLLCHTFEAENNGRAVLYIDSLLFCPNQHYRSAVVDYLCLMGSSDVISKDSVSLISENKSSLLEDDIDIWQPTAERLWAKCREDIKLNIAGVRQSISLKYDEGLNDFSNKVLWPTLEAINVLPIEIIRPSTQSKIIENNIRELSKSNYNLGELCGQYLKEMGYVPLGSSFSLLSLLRVWEEQSGNKIKFKSLLEWSVSEGSPLSKYHVLSVALEEPSLIEEHQLAAIVKDLVTFFLVDETDSEPSKIGQDSLLRSELAKHYSAYISILSPNLDMEAASVGGWWLADCVASAFEGGPQFTKHIRKTKLAPALRTVLVLKKIAAADHQSSSLSFSTMFLGSPWEHSLKCLLSNIAPHLSKATQDIDCIDKLDDAMVEGLVHTFGLNIGDDATYMISDKDLLSAAKEWAEVFSKSRTAEFVAGFGAICQLDESDEQLVKALTEIDKSDEASQVLIAGILRSKAYLGSVPVDAIWGVISTEGWVTRALTEISENALLLLTEALCLIQLGERNHWQHDLPHYIALACERSTENVDRCRLLFNATIETSFAGRTAGAIQRLLSGSVKKYLTEDIQSIREVLGDVARVAPPWIASKIRGILTILHVGQVGL